MLEVKPAKVETTPLIVAPDVTHTKPLADNDAVVAAPLEIVGSPLLVTKALKLNLAIVVITLLTIKPLVLVTTLLEVKPAKLESAPLIVVPDMPLIRPANKNASVVAAPLQIVRTLLLVIKALEFNPAIVAMTPLTIKPSVLNKPMLKRKREK